MSVARVIVRVPTRKSLGGNPRLAAHIEGKPLVEFSCELIPKEPAGILVAGRWYVLADRDEDFRLFEFWRDAR